MISFKQCNILAYKVCALCTFCLLFLAELTFAQPTKAPQKSLGMRWQKIGYDLETATYKDNPNALISSELLFVRSSLKKLQLSVVRAEEHSKNRMHIDSLCNASNALVCINANFFDKSSKALGLVVQQGVEHNRIHRGGKTLTGVFYVNRNSFFIVPREKIPESGILHAVQAGPRLISKGKKIAGFSNNKNTFRRSGICIDKEKRVVFFVNTSSFGGVTLQKLQDVLTSKELSCLDALNFDGGGSSQLFISSNIPGSSKSYSGLTIYGRDKIPVALALK